MKDDVQLVDASPGMTRLTMIVDLLDHEQGGNDSTVVATTEVPLVAGPWGADDVIDVLMPYIAWLDDAELEIRRQRLYIDGYLLSDVKFA